MRKLLALLSLITFSGSAFSQELNSYLEKMFDETKESFADYSKRAPEQIYDHRYDETDKLLFIRIGLIDGYNNIFPKEEIKAYKTKLVIAISDVFTEDQLEAIVQMGNDVDNKKSAKYFKAAHLFKTGKLKEKKIIKKL